MTISIHQPNFCPRASYFEKIAQCDLFVIMSHCQFNSEAYQHRFNIGDKFYTMPVSKRMELIGDTTYKLPFENWARITTKFPKLHHFDDCVHMFLNKMNTNIIFKTCNLLGIKTDMAFDFPTPLRGTERLINLCKTFGADRYLSGISGRNYLDLPMFEREGIEVIFQDETKMDKRPLCEII